MLSQLPQESLVTLAALAIVLSIYLYYSIEVRPRTEGGRIDRTVADIIQWMQEAGAWQTAGRMEVISDSEVRLVWAKGGTSGVVPKGRGRRDVAGVDRRHDDDDELEEEESRASRAGRGEQMTHLSGAQDAAERRIAAIQAAYEAGIPVHFSIGSAAAFEKRMREAQLDAGVPAANHMDIVYVGSANIGRSLLEVAPTMVLVTFLLLSLQAAAKAARSGGGLGGGLGGKGGGGSPFQFGASKAKKYNREDNVGVRFTDVAGLPEAKIEVQEFVDFLKNPEKYTTLGAKIPKGALLAGPPGTGKTLLAKAAAGEAGVPFFVTSGSEFLEMFVGVGPSRVRDLFKQARKAAPSVVFIDEIDAIGRSRSSGRAGGNEERENTLNALLVEMDGFGTTDSEPVVVLAGTNRADLLDKALLRPGRFDRSIEVDLPDRISRVDILKVHLRNIVLLDPVTNKALEGESERRTELKDAIAERLASLTPSFSGADLANVCNEAAILAARRGADGCIDADFDGALERVVGGLAKREPTDQGARSSTARTQERRILAAQEAGKAVAAWLLPGVEKPLKVSIVARSKAPSGYTMMSTEERYLRSTAQVSDRLCHLLAGRVATELLEGAPTTSSHSDLQQATKLAYRMIGVFGFSKTFGPFHFSGGESGWGSAGFRAPYSDQTAEQMDKEVRALLDESHTRAKELLTSVRPKLDELAAILLERDEARESDIEALLGPKRTDAVAADGEKDGSDAAGAVQPVPTA
uniref:AAA+ ATPase domain-containing protein n=1 Tax=Sexangularia sp. CB-2014 TaxID=1486929 RepID=A0A7S1VCD2_9EUKA|mmetsp:Transcript_16130/g.50451  ORF Transcript_16130/g.50451 Transcript_16130/m.50451 type:complete len:750 (+) Transcript_16130:623-2872(+)